MMTVRQVSELAGVSIRTLRYYDRIGLLSPSGHTEGGYRLYDYAALERLQQILLFRELEFPLKDIIRIMGAADFDREKALEQQIELLELKKQHLEDLIGFARGIKMLGVRAVDFSAFDKSKLEEYAEKAKKQWGDTPEYREYSEKHGGRSAEEESGLSLEMMALFAEFGAMKNESPSSAEAAEQVRKLQRFITENFYNCTDEILLELGKMYAAGGEFTENIDKAGGKGTAEFAAAAIEACCGEN
ncbi:MerR family transcriptional regulator [uncultured Ruminococcus sp.]|uniref:MerR family transcriptional regulator n=1 Tax=uncultured Ruminococcus sp. TaxID=165186 RepID=UPI0026329EC3|nr:MerR family transcriptional regulator [uncultured Ruminococcus sp.]